MSPSPVQPASGASSEAESPVPLSTQWVMGSLGGVIWVSTGLVFGYPARDLLWLAAPAAVTLSVALLAASGWAAMPAWRAPLALGTTGLLCLAFVLGQFLQANTNHRPLGAVTWASTCALAAFPLASFALRTPRLQKLGSWLLLAVVLGIVGVAAPMAEWRSWAPLLSGAASFALCVYLRRRVRVPAWVAGVLLLVLVAAFVALARSDEAARLAEVAPIWLGTAILLR